MIDSEGYRPNVGIILCNAQKQVLWARRIGQNAWQFPQGGIKCDETPEEALYRELWEEVGLVPEKVETLFIKALSSFWIAITNPICVFTSSSESSLISLE